MEVRYILPIKRVYCFTITALSVMMASVTTLEVPYVNRWGLQVYIAGEMATFGHLDKTATQLN